MKYEDFVLQLGFDPEGGYSVRVVASPAGEGASAFKLPFSAKELRRHHPAWSNGAARSNDVLPLGNALRHAEHLTKEVVGEQLFRALFTEEIRDLYNRSLGKIGEVSGRGLRIKLKLDQSYAELAPIHNLPWELLRRPDTREFLSLSRSSPIIRYLDVPRPVRVQPLPQPLGILVVFANPSTSDPLDLDRERANIEAVWGSHEDVDVEFLEPGQFKELRPKLLEREFHILHFMGHGGFDSASGEGLLLFERDEGRPHPVSGESLATVLKDFRTLRLATLNACETARATDELGHNPFAGVASALVLGGFPAVLAMQFPVSDAAALIFSSTLYKRVAAGDPIDTAVAEARLAIFSHWDKGAEWATPVLFMRVPDGTLFKPKAFDGPIRIRKPKKLRMPDRPYPVLLPYSHPELFAGRRWELAELKRLLLPHSIVGMHAPSGAGKSSLLRAGLVPALRAEGIPVAFARRPHEPGLPSRLVNALLTDTTADNGELEVEEDPELFLKWIHEARSLTGKPPILILDQCEDLLRTQNSRRSRAILGLLLATTAKAQFGLDDAPCRWVLAYRRDVHGDMTAWLHDVLEEARGLNFATEGLPCDLSSLERFHDWPLRPLGAVVGSESSEQATAAFQAAIETPLELKKSDGSHRFPWHFADDEAARLARAFGAARKDLPDVPLVPQLQVVLAHLLGEGGTSEQPKVVTVPEDPTTLIEQALEEHLRRAMESVPSDRTRTLLALWGLADSARSGKQGLSSERLEQIIGPDADSILRALEDEKTRLIVARRDRGGELHYSISHDQMVDVVLRMVEKEERQRGRLTVDKEVLELRSFVSLNSELYASGDGEHVTRLEGRQFRQISAHADALLWGEEEEKWWTACQTRRKQELHQMVSRWAAVGASIMLIVVLGFFMSRQSEKKALFRQLTLSGEDAGVAMEALYRLAVEYEAEPDEISEQFRLRASWVDLFEEGVAKVAAEQRSQAVLIAARSMIPLIEEWLQEELIVKSSAAEDQRRLSAVDLIGLIAWVLDYCPRRQEMLAQQANSVRNALLAELRRLRPPPQIGPSEPGWVSIPGGTFEMKSRPSAGADSSAYENEQATHLARVSAFRMLDHEVSNREFSVFDPSYRMKDPELPAIEINWYRAYSYSAWLGGRLPTEAEWEYASRAGCPLENYFCSADSKPSSLEKLGWFRDHPAFRADPLMRGLQPIKKLEPNAWGLYDMYGNAWEWVADWAGPSSNEIEDGYRWSAESLEVKRRIRLGGWWFGKSIEATSRLIDPIAPAESLGSQGFRVVISGQNNHGGSTRGKTGLSP